MPLVIPEKDNLSTPFPYDYPIPKDSPTSERNQERKIQVPQAFLTLFPRFSFSASPPSTTSPPSFSPFSSSSLTLTLLPSTSSITPLFLFPPALTIPSRFLSFALFLSTSVTGNPISAAISLIVMPAFRP
ncbi:unnamed protein product [Periconia digitata]|uniref:Uncharacterized protein n=1 Tax=Periconia digitata TaxID=1303443 RepID=A0A9W4UPS9_9PLEO|nr:unnamed protein product [Periconia digitata]